MLGARNGVYKGTREGGGRRGRIYTDQRIDMHISIACNRIIQVLALKGKQGGILDTLREICLGG
jgi:hypothetical protein